MNDYCVTFVHMKDGEEPSAEEVFHCHVLAPVDHLALETALRRSVEDNIQLSRANAVSIRMVLPLPTTLMGDLELLRVAQNGATPTLTPMAPASHLH